MFTAYNSATRKIDPKEASVKVDQLGSLVADMSRRELEYTKQRQIDVVHSIDRMEREIRDQNRTLRLRNEEIKSLEAAANPAALKRAINLKAKKSTALNEKMVEDLRQVEDRIFVTTADLSFAKGKFQTPRGFSLSDLNIGRFLIMICPNQYTQYHNLSTCIQICNLTWRVGAGSTYYHHPFIKERGLVCFGDTNTEFQNLFKNVDIIGIIDLALALLVTPKDGNAWISWNTYFQERGPLEQRLQDGEYYWDFHDGPRSREIYFADAKKKQTWTKAMKAAIGSGWVGMIEANNPPSIANQIITSEVTNLFSLIYESRDSEYKEKIKAMKELVKNYQRVNRPTPQLHSIMDDLVSTQVVPARYQEASIQYDVDPAFEMLHRQERERHRQVMQTADWVADPHIAPIEEVDNPF